MLTMYQCWGETFGYDIWGNLLSIGGLSGYTGCTQENLSVGVSTKNQITNTGFTYDAAGDVLTDGTTTGKDYDQNFAVVQADPSKVDSDDLRGVFLNPDGSTTPGEIPGANIEEAAAHELLGHVWADLFGGQVAGTNGNKREALIAEDRVRNTDPARGLKIRHQGQPESVQLIRTTDLPRITSPGSQP